MTTVREALRPALAFLTALVVAGCGVQPEESPTVVPTAGPPSSTGAIANDPAGQQLTMYLVRDADLAPVQRRARSATAAAALALLVEGPTAAEASRGLSTALPAESVEVDLDLADGEATVSVRRGFAGIPGGNQLLAVAQIVWTLTESPRVTAVRFAVEDSPVEVPTDSGLADRPVTRADFRSVTPVPTETTRSPTEEHPPTTPTGSPSR
jgi:spore germination protein GerM